MKSLYQVVESLLDADYGSGDNDLLEHILEEFFKSDVKYTYTLNKDQLRIKFDKHAPYVIDFWSFQGLSKFGIRHIEFLGGDNRTLRCFAGGVSDISIGTDSEMEFRGSKDYTFSNTRIRCKYLMIGERFKKTSSVSFDKCSIKCTVLLIPTLQQELKVSSSCKMYTKHVCLQDAGKFLENIYQNLGISTESWNHYLYEEPTLQEIEDAKKIDVWGALNLQEKCWPGLSKFIIGIKEDDYVGVAVYRHYKHPASNYRRYNLDCMGEWKLSALYNIDDELRASFYLK